MEKLDVFQKIAVRTSGDVSIGIVGPVRTGKSTLVKRLMDVLVIPRMTDPEQRARTIDELPQSGAGKTVMTTEPKFIPDEPVTIALQDGTELSVRLADSVGYPVPGARGYEDEDGPRMVQTPWFDTPITFEEAAEFGTRKIVADHATLTLIVTTDGSIGELPRDAFVAAEQQCVADVRSLQKPFVMLLNTRDPQGAQALSERLSDQYDAPVIPVDIARLNEADLMAILHELLLEFPVTELNVRLPKWVEALAEEHWLRLHYQASVHDAVGEILRLRDVEQAARRLQESEHVEKVDVADVDLGTGIAVIDVDSPEALFWQVLEEVSGFRIDGKDVLLSLMQELAKAKRAYDKFGPALETVLAEGYARVQPTLADLQFEEPELIRKGNQFGVRLRANAKTLHLLRADISTEVTPIIGTEKQSESLVNYLLEKFEDDPQKIWESDIFGQPLSALLHEGIDNKLNALPENARQKLRLTLERVINEGSGGLICIIL